MRSGRTLALLFFASASPGFAQTAPSRRVVLESGGQSMCRNRGRAVARAMPLDTSAPQQPLDHVPVVFVSRDILAVRDATSQILVRELPSLRELATLTGAGGIVHADANRVILWRREAQSPLRRYTQRTLVSIDVATRHETISPSMPLPEWLLATNDPESAEAVRATVDGNDVVLNWSAVTSWNGGVAPSEAQRAAAHHEDCGSLRIGANGAVTEGSYIPTRGGSRMPPPSVSAGRGVTPRYAGDGLYWIDRIDQTTGAHSSSLADGARPPVPIVLGAVPNGSIPIIEGLWIAGARVIVLRAFQRTDTYSLPRDVSVIDRTTGAVLWSTPVERLEVLPPRP